MGNSCRRNFLCPSVASKIAEDPVPERAAVPDDLPDAVPTSLLVESPTGERVIDIDILALSMRQRQLKNMRHQILHDQELFILNNLLLSVQFFKNFDREKPSWTRSALNDDWYEGDRISLVESSGERKRFIALGAVHEKASSGCARFQATRGGNVEPLHPFEHLIIYDNIDVHVHQEFESLQATESQDKSTFRMCLEEVSHHPGYARLRCVDRAKSAYPIGNSYEEIDDSEGYTKSSEYEAEPTAPSTSSDTDENRPPEEQPNPPVLVNEPLEKLKNTICSDPVPPPVPPPISTLPPTPPPSPPEDDDVDQDLRLQAPSTKRKRKASREYVTTLYGNSLTLEEPNAYSSTSSSLRSPSPVLPATQNTDYEDQSQKTSVIDSSDSYGTLRQLSDVEQTDSPTLNRDQYLKEYNKQRKYKKSGSISSGYYSHGRRLSTSESEHTYSSSIYGFEAPIVQSRPLRRREKNSNPLVHDYIPTDCFMDFNAIVPRDDYEDIDGCSTIRERRCYFSSLAFMYGFQDVFVDMAESKVLGVSECINDATVLDSIIQCQKIFGPPGTVPVMAQLTFTPCLEVPFWPGSAYEWLTRKRNRIVDNRTKIAYTFPTRRQIENIQSMGALLKPQWRRHHSGTNRGNTYLEWQLSFERPEAYLFSALSHTQVRCYQFMLLLQKAYLEGQGVLEPYHWKNILFWMCEGNFLQWHEEDLGIQLRRCVENAYKGLMAENLPHYFVVNRNLFESCSKRRLRHAQARLKRVKDNILMHVLNAMRHLRPTQDSFYPFPDLQKLHTLLTEDTQSLILSINSSLLGSRSAQRHSKSGRSTKEMSFWEMQRRRDQDIPITPSAPVSARPSDPRLRQRQVYAMYVRDQQLSELQTKATSADSPRDSAVVFNEKVKIGKLERIRCLRLLDYFCNHFVRMATASVEFGAFEQAAIYAEQVEALSILLEEYGDSDAADSFREQVAPVHEHCSYGEYLARRNKLGNCFVISSSAKRLSQCGIGSKRLSAVTEHEEAPPTVEAPPRVLQINTTPTSEPSTSGLQLINGKYVMNLKKQHDDTNNITYL